MNAPWKDWTKDDWDNAEYCPDCGLPLIPVETGEGVGVTQCVYCTWRSDELDARGKRVKEKEPSEGDE